DQVGQLVAKQLAALGPACVGVPKTKRGQRVEYPEIAGDSAVYGLHANDCHDNGCRHAIAACRLIQYGLVLRPEGGAGIDAYGFNKTIAISHPASTYTCLGWRHELGR